MAVLDLSPQTLLRDSLSQLRTAEVCNSSAPLSCMLATIADELASKRAKVRVMHDASMGQSKTHMQRGGSG